MMLNSTCLFRRLNASIDDTHATHLIAHCIALARRVFCDPHAANHHRPHIVFALERTVSSIARSLTSVLRRRTTSRFFWSSAIPVEEGSRAKRSGAGGALVIGPKFPHISRARSWQKQRPPRGQDPRALGGPNG
jgi:hypothetical protein